MAYLNIFVSKGLLYTVLIQGFLYTVFIQGLLHTVLIHGLLYTVLIQEIFWGKQTTSWWDEEKKSLLGNIRNFTDIVRIDPIVLFQ